MSDKKDKDLPDPDELQKMLQDMFGKLGNGVSMPFPNAFQDEPTSDSEAADDAPMEMNRADEIFDFNYKPIAL